MRRDYFTCVFLLYVAASLAFCCVLPTYYAYGEIIPRDISLLERIISLICVIVVLIGIPIISSIKKRKWVIIGSSAYGLLAYLPAFFLTRLEPSLQGSDASIIAVGEQFILKAIYVMVNAPYAGISKLVGDKVALTLPKLILPISVGCYLVVQLFRFYRNAYINEQLKPVTTHRTPERPVAEARKPEILGTVISAPVNPATPKPQPQQAQPQQQAQAPQPQKVPIQQPQLQQPARANQQVMAATNANSGNNGAMPKSIPNNTAPEVRNDNIIYAEPTVRAPKIDADATRVIPLGAPAPDKNQNQ